MEEMEEDKVKDSLVFIVKVIYYLSIYMNTRRKLQSSADYFWHSLSNSFAEFDNNLYFQPFCKSAERENRKELEGISKY